MAAGEVAAASGSFPEPPGGLRVGGIWGSPGTFSPQLTNAIWFLFNPFLLKHPLPNTQQPFSMFSLSARSGFDPLGNGDISCQMWQFLFPSRASAAQLPPSLAVQRLGGHNVFGFALRPSQQGNMSSKIAPLRLEVHTEQSCTLQSSQDITSNTNTSRLWNIFLTSRPLMFKYLERLLCLSTWNPGLL